MEIGLIGILESGQSISRSENFYGYRRRDGDVSNEQPKRRRLTKKERQEVYEKCNGHCAYCGCELSFEKMQVDHVIPLGGWRIQGTDTLGNMFPACRSCNHYKSRNTLEGFRKMLEDMPKVLQRDSVTYKNAVRYGLVIPRPKPVVFYFEKLGGTGT